MNKKVSGLLVFALSAAAFLSAGAGLASCGNPAPASESGQSQTYRITVEGEGFQVVGLPEGNVAEEGARIRFTIEVTEEGKVVSAVTMNGETLTVGGGGRYSFNMPAADVTLSISIVGVSSIEVDVSSAKTAFLIGSTFDSSGLKISAKYDSGESQEVTTGFTVSSPDMSSEGTKTVEVTYGGLKDTYDIVVGTLVRGATNLSNKSDKAVLTITGTFTGFSSAAQLTAAAKGVYFFDLQYNASFSAAAPGWDRMLKTGEIEYKENGAGGFTFDVDVSELAAAGGKGMGYTMHFGLANTEGQDIGEPGDWKVSETVDQTITIGNRVYSLIGRPGSESGSEFWGNYGLIIVDNTTPSMNATDIDLKVEDNKAYAIVKGKFSHLDPADLDGKVLCDIQELYAWTEIASYSAENPIKTTIEDQLTSSGTFEIAFDITDKLGNANPYFFHFHYDAGGNPVAKEHNINWDASTMTEKTITDPVNGGEVTFAKSTTTDWSSNLAVLKFLGGDYVKGQAVTIANADGKAIVTYSGAYSGIVNNDNGDYRFSVQALDTWEMIVGGDSGVEAELALTPESPEATKGTFALSADLTGKLEAGKEYFMHFGPGDGDGPNVYAFEGQQSVSFELSDGTYQLRTISGATGSGNEWRNGLVGLSFVAK
ncbi:MAG: bacterial Ig-like domain-containing protein [Bacilli bacterium]|nr:bacterial Ig-like domain-containing protein [Bacilli bacterium]